MLCTITQTSTDSIGQPRSQWRYSSCVWVGCGQYFATISFAVICIARHRCYDGFIHLAASKLQCAIAVGMLDFVHRFRIYAVCSMRINVPVPVAGPSGPILDLSNHFPNRRLHLPFISQSPRTTCCRPSDAGRGSSGIETRHFLGSTTP